MTNFNVEIVKQSVIQHLEDKMHEIPTNITTQDYVTALEEMTEDLSRRKTVLQRMSGKLGFKRVDSQNYDIHLGDLRIGVLEKDSENSTWALWLGKDIYYERHHMDMLAEDTSRKRLENQVRQNLQSYLEYITRRGHHHTPYIF